MKLDEADCKRIRVKQVVRAHAGKRRRKFKTFKTTTIFYKSLFEGE